MLASNSQSPPAMTYAFPGDRAVRLAAGLCCPHCEHTLRAADIDIDGLGIGLTCQHCHHTILTIEAH